MSTWYLLGRPSACSYPRLASAALDSTPRTDLNEGDRRRWSSSDLRGDEQCTAWRRDDAQSFEIKTPSFAQRPAMENGPSERPSLLFSLVFHFFSRRRTTWFSTGSRLFHFCVHLRVRQRRGVGVKSERKATDGSEPNGVRLCAVGDIDSQSWSRHQSAWRVAKVLPGWTKIHSSSLWFG